MPDLVALFKEVQNTLFEVSMSVGKKTNANHFSKVGKGPVQNPKFAALHEILY
jgi:hypothetical protein